MECEICGKFYSVAHECAGVRPGISEREAVPLPTGFAPLYYVRLAVGIMRWDDVSVRRAARDRWALLYGICFWLIAAFIIFTPQVVRQLPQTLAQAGVVGGSGVIGLIIGLITIAGVLVFAGFVFLFQLVVCHAIARWIFGGSGTFIRLLRPLLLGWPVNIVTLIPIVGVVAGGLLWAAVMMVVFEEVNQIRRVHAFGISYAVNIALIVVVRALAT